MAFYIKEVRQARGMTQQELAELSGVSRVVISGLETGERENTNTKTVQALASALGVPVQQIFFDESVRRNEQRG